MRVYGFLFSRFGSKEQINVFLHDKLRKYSIVGSVTYSLLIAYVVKKNKINYERCDVTCNIKHSEQGVSLQ